MTKEELQKAFDKANKEMLKNGTFTKAIDNLANGVKSDNIYTAMTTMVANALKESILVNQEVLYQVLLNLCDDKDCKD